MSRAGDRSSPPRAVIHKRILDAAESDPEASMAEIAETIAGASTDLVERVFEQYGDPAEGDQVNQHADQHADRQAAETHDDRDDAAERDGSLSTDEQGGPDDAESPGGDEPEEERADEPTGRDADGTESPGETSDPMPTTDATEPEMKTDENGRHEGDHAELSEKQLEALRLIDRNPDASQGELAEEFDVTRATVSRWLNDIPGFEWARRAEHAAELLNGREIRGTGGPVEAERFEALARRLDAVEGRLEDVAGDDETATEGATGDGITGLDPELAHKVVHACMNSERITEDEELRLLEELMR